MRFFFKLIIFGDKTCKKQPGRPARQHWAARGIAKNQKPRAGAWQRFLVGRK
ncbi:hypothetical protein [Emticicia sp. 21SJ11W-3]|uniref:hypothetical protein n=1 Tax=Emticicia sp. 21SJ11W-3 TaxID=2916755 RepID=UPI0020A00033|nr:hypothetical protein [Emticicia sp. 21SJ11W-3]UTA66556.1 hypothetical protein MB380_13195 [Emticicia sp. 21SJ11W-3]